MCVPTHKILTEGIRSVTSSLSVGMARRSVLKVTRLPLRDLPNDTAVWERAVES